MMKRSIKNSAKEEQARVNLFSKLRLHKKLVIGVLVLGTILGLFLAWAGFRVKKYNQNKYDYKRPLEIRNLTYCNGEKLDLFVPQSEAPVPLVIYIHGGGWRYGSKVGGTLSMIKPLLKKDMAVASINYRLSGDAKFPAQVEDVLCSVRYLRLHAKQYGISPNKIGLVGISAGGHLAALAANASNEATFKKGDYQEANDSVQAVVSISGLLNLETTTFTKTSEANMKRLFEKDDMQTRKLASPQNYLDAHDPPQLIIYSPQDKKVRPQQSIEYIDAAEKAGVNVQPLRVESADHNLRPDRAFRSKPNRSEIIDRISQFFEKNLR